jgi:hypothetical protein
MLPYDVMNGDVVLTTEGALGKTFRVSNVRATDPFVRLVVNGLFMPGPFPAISERSAADEIGAEERLR